MIYAGSNIRNSGERMVAISIDHLYESIRSPKEDIAAKVRQLRIVKQIDMDRYKEQKKELPYFVCGNFNPSIRKIVYFAFIEYFVVDIDHIASHRESESLNSIRQRINSDSSVVMSFVSPSADGLKVVFRLRERCYDHSMYSLFYKAFVREFAEKHGIMDLVDTRTSDVTRACFISMDEEVYYNKEAEPINMGDIIDLDNPVSLEELLDSTEELPFGESKETPRDPEAEVMEKIKGILDERRRSKADCQRTIFVPERICQIMSGVESMFADNFMEMYDASDIQYGKRIKVRVGTKSAEMNIFYGHAGFSVVSIPRRGTSQELNEMASELLRDYLEEIVA